jgi:hypothetical protein
MGVNARGIQELRGVNTLKAAKKSLLECYLIGQRCFTIRLSSYTVCIMRNLRSESMPMASWHASFLGN